MNFKKLMISGLLAGTLAFSSIGGINQTYADEIVGGNSQNATQSSKCANSFIDVMNNSLMNNFDLGRTLQCKKPGEKNTAIVGIVNGIFNVFIFPIVLLIIIFKIIKSGDGNSNGGGYSSMGGSSGGISEGFKNYVSSKGTEIALFIIILGIWQLGFLDLFIFFIRAGLKSFGTDTGQVLDV